MPLVLPYNSPSHLGLSKKRLWVAKKTRIIISAFKGSNPLHRREGKCLDQIGSRFHSSFRKWHGFSRLMLNFLAPLEMPKGEFRAGFVSFKPAVLPPSTHIPDIKAKSFRVTKLHFCFQNVQKFNIRDPTIYLPIR